MRGYLEDIESRSVSGRLFVKVSSQVGLTVCGDNIFPTLQERVMKWAFDPKRNVQGVPDEAWRGEAFEISTENSEQVEAVVLEEPRYWAFRLCERLKDTGRIWTTEVGIAERSMNEVAFGCRVICSQRGNAEPIPRSIPRLVRNIVFAEQAFLDGRQTAAEPWIVSTNGEVDEFVSFLKKPDRNHPVIVFSLPEGRENPRDTVISPGDFIRQTAGFVHSVVLTSPASYALTNRLGKEFSVYRQAIRTYNPGFDPDADLPTDHPLATAARIKNWESDKAFIDFLVDQTLRLTRPRDVLEREQPSFLQIKRHAAEQARQKASSEGQTDSDQLRLAIQEVSTLKQEVELSVNMATEAEKEREEARSELAQEKARYMALQARLNAVLKERPATVPALPDTLDEIECWAERNLSGQVVVLPRALKSLRDSKFKNVKLVCDALVLMRDHYIPMRRIGGNDCKTQFEAKLADLGLDNTKCFAQENKAKKYCGEYYVTYQGVRHELDWHLKGSNSRDERQGFRLYYFWDTDTEQVIVGHLPSHLRTDIT